MGQLTTSLDLYKKRCRDIANANIHSLEEKIQKNYAQLKTLELPINVCDLFEPHSIKLGNEVVIPQTLRIGTEEYEMSDKSNVSLPLTLTTSNSNAFYFEIDDPDSANLMQQLAFRILLSLKPGLCHLYLADANFGTWCTPLSQISHPHVEINNFRNERDIEQLLKDLTNVVVEANISYKANYASLSSYNAKNENSPKPYHVVFIDDFPANFSESSLMNLKRLIDKGFAASSGIYIFLNYKKEYEGERDAYGVNKFDITQIKNVCTSVAYDSVNKETTINDNILNEEKTKINLDLRPCYIGKKVQELLDNYHDEKHGTDLLDEWITQQKQNDNIWKQTTLNGINVPVGLKSDGSRFMFSMGNDAESRSDYFSIIIGKTNMGKTFFLHTIITQACMYYSPEQLELYLLDFAHGSGFMRYKPMPHTKAVMSANSIEFAYRTLLHLHGEVRRRAMLYTEAEERLGVQVDKLYDYCKITGQSLPRILLVIDEFQTLFNKRDFSNQIAEEARKLLIECVRQWRKYGILVILSTQTMSGIDIGESMSQITYRFAFTVDAEDSHSLIGNEGASRLAEVKGRCIMHNATDRSERFNVMLDNVWSRDYKAHIDYLSRHYKEVYNRPLPERFVCDNYRADIKDNKDIPNLTLNQHDCTIYVGKPALLRSTHTRLRLRRQPNSNILIVGQETPTAINLVVGILMQARKQSVNNSRFYIIDCTPVGDQYQNSFETLPTLSPDFIVGSESLLDDLMQELQKRKTEQAMLAFSAERIFVSVFNVQGSQPLRKIVENFGMMSPMGTSLLTLIHEGPALGIHVIVHGLSSSMIFGTMGVLQPEAWKSFENKIMIDGADLKTMEALNYDLHRFESVGNNMLLVDNNSLDNEKFELCKAYCRIDQQAMDMTRLNDYIMKNI